MHLASVPQFHWIAVKPVKIFMISIHEQRGKWLFFQPVQQVLFFLVFHFFIPDTAEISTYDHIVFLCHLLLFWKYFCIKFPEILMAVARYIDHSYHLFSTPPPFHLPPAPLSQTSWSLFQMQSSLLSHPSARPRLCRIFYG